MREIRFSAKNIKTQEWIYGYYLYIKEQDKHYILTGKLKTYPVDAVHPYLVTEGFEWIEIDPRTLRRFTSILDKNECEIYEGDIVRTERGRICKVVWFSSEAYCGFDLLPLECKNPAPIASTIWKPENIEVIGNIYDNPELLKESKYD